MEKKIKNKNSILLILLTITNVIILINVIYLNSYSPYDVNKDGRISVADYAMIKSYLLSEGE